MAKQSTFGFTNVDTTQRSYNDYTLGVTTNYALLSDEPTQVILDNKCAPLDQQEIITYQARVLPRVNTSSYLINNYPTKLDGGMQYVIKVEELLSTTDNTLGTRIDEPIVMYLTVKHPRSGNISASALTTVFNRLKGAILKSDGTYRWDELMRLSLKPTDN
jgi:hypothetical protein